MARPAGAVGNWKSVYNRSQLAAKDVWVQVFRELPIDVDETASIVHGIVVRAHQDAAAKRGSTECSGTLSRRFSTKIHAIVDAKGRPLHVALTPGERREMIAAPELLDFARGDALIGDTGYDSNEFRAELKTRGIKAVVSSEPERKRKIPKNRTLCRTRYLVEVFFHSLERFRGIARALTRPERATSPLSTLSAFACGSIS